MDECPMRLDTIGSGHSNPPSAFARAAPRGIEMSQTVQAGVFGATVSVDDTGLYPERLDSSVHNVFEQFDVADPLGNT